MKGPKVSKGRVGKPLGRLRRGETLRKTGKSKEGSFLCLPQEICFFLASSHCRKRAPKVSKGRSESPLVASAEAKPSVLRKRKEGIFPLSFIRNSFFVSLVRYKRWAPKGSRGRAESPLVASAEAKPSAKQKKQGSSFSLPSTRNLFLVRGFVRLRADEVLSHTGKYPKGAGGGQRVHGTWPPPDPPLLRNSAPLASQGRAQLGSRPSLGGPLSPSAQLIPPPAPRRRSILGV